MKTKILLFVNVLLCVVIGFLLLACKPINQPEPCGGIIVGTICCVDTVNQSAMQGYYIITDKSDSILTFSDEITLSTYAGISGIYRIDDYKIPFQFTYSVLKPSEADYIQYRLPISNTLYPGMKYPIEHFKQALLKPLN
jgi:hypothetical protein